MSALTTTWVQICGVDDIAEDTGVCALVGTYQVAVFRVSGVGELFALSNLDPFSETYVMSRGIVGSAGDIVKVSSPMYKHGFDLRTGKSLDDPSVCIPTFRVREESGRVFVAVPQSVCASVERSEVDA